MAEVCRDFGRRLIRGWDEKAEKEEVRAYVEESIEAFFNKTKAKETKETEVTVESPSPKKKVTKSKTPEKKAPAKGKAAKGKGVEKAKCKAVTAKGLPCSKNATEGCEFCSVHAPKDKTAVLDKTVTEKASGSGTKAKAPAKSKAPAKAKKSKPESAKHTGAHGPDEVDEDGCELCASHGGPFELPDYETVSVKKDTYEAEIEEEEEEEIDNIVMDPDYDNGSEGGLTEEDFDEDD